MEDKSYLEAPLTKVIRIGNDQISRFHRSFGRQYHHLVHIVHTNTTGCSSESSVRTHSVIVNSTMVDRGYRTTQAAKLFSSLEIILDPRSYVRLSDPVARHAKESLVDSIGKAGWVGLLVEALEKLVAASVSFLFGSQEVGI